VAISVLRRECFHGVAELLADRVLQDGAGSWRWGPRLMPGRFERWALCEKGAGLSSSMIISSMSTSAPLR